jgi:hypothetical protein
VLQTYDWQHNLLHQQQQQQQQQLVDVAAVALLRGSSLQE